MTHSSRASWIALGFGLCLAAVFFFFAGVFATTEYFRIDWHQTKALLDAETTAVVITHAELKDDLKKRNVVCGRITARRKSHVAIGGSEQP